MNTTSARYLKLLGHLPQVECKDLEKNADLMVDPALVEMTRDRMCSHPDNPDPEIASANPGKLASQFKISTDEAANFIVAHARMRKAEENSISWPRGCHDNYGPHPHGHLHRNRHAAKFYVDIPSFERRGIHYLEQVTKRDLEWVAAAGVWRWSLEEIMDLWSGKPMLQVAVDLMVETMRLCGFSMIQIDDGPEGTEHNIHISCVPKPGSIIGEAWFNNGSCSDHVNHHIDSDWRPGLAGTASLLSHEGGHNLNWRHTFPGQDSHHGIMGYSPPYVNGKRQFYGISTGESPHVLPRDPVWSQIEKLFDTNPVPLAQESPPSKPEEPKQPPKIIVGTFKDDITGAEYVISRRQAKTDEGIIW